MAFILQSFLPHRSCSCHLWHACHSFATPVMLGAAAPESVERHLSIVTFNASKLRCLTRGIVMRPSFQAVLTTGGDSWAEQQRRQNLYSASWTSPTDFPPHKRINSPCKAPPPLVPLSAAAGPHLDFRSLLFLRSSWVWLGHSAVHQPTSWPHGNNASSYYCPLPHPSLLLSLASLYSGVFPTQLELNISQQCNNDAKKLIA